MHLYVHCKIQRLFYLLLCCFDCKRKNIPIKLVKPKSKIIAEKEGLLALVSEKFIVTSFKYSWI